MAAANDFSMAKYLHCCQMRRMRRMRRAVMQWQTHHCQSDWRKADIDEAEEPKRTEKGKVARILIIAK